MSVGAILYPPEKPKNVPPPENVPPLMIPGGIEVIELVGTGLLMEPTRFHPVATSIVSADTVVPVKLTKPPNEVLIQYPGPFTIDLVPTYPPQ